ncbi:MAG: metal-dependent transcriptional regulator [Candidatus Hermodarchaeota archaeon]
MSDIQESYENYLKAIYLISKKNRGGWCSNSEISEYLAIKPASVTNMLYKLKENGLIKWSPRKSIRLTLKGKEIAEDTLTNYEILKKFFKNVLKIQDSSLVEELSCGIEHHITPKISEAIENLIE